MGLDLIIIYILSLITSLGMNIALYFKMSKDIADQGYKIDIEKTSEFLKQFKELQQQNKIILFLPIVNIFAQYMALLKYVQNRYMVVDEFRVIGCLQQFTKEEEEAYNKKPTGLTAVALSIKPLLNNRLNNQVIKFNYTDPEGNKSTFLYKIEDNKVVIAKVEGYLENLSPEEQHQKLMSIFEKIAAAKEEDISIEPSEVEPEKISAADDSRLENLEKKKQILYELKEVLNRRKDTNEESQDTDCKTRKNIRF